MGKEGLGGFRHERTTRGFKVYRGVCHGGPPCLDIERGKRRVFPFGEGPLSSVTQKTHIPFKSKEDFV